MCPARPPAWVTVGVTLTCIWKGGCLSLPGRGTKTVACVRNETYPPNVLIMSSLQHKDRGRVHVYLSLAATQAVCCQKGR